MKKIIVILLTTGSMLFNGCIKNIKSKSGSFGKSINSANMKNYKVSMRPYSFQLIYISNHTTPLADADKGWWKDAIVYQVYPRSFQDSDGNGHGDLPGLTSRLDYIQDMGFNAIWTLPIFYALNDGSTGRALGYEAIDYYDINPIYGSMSDFDEYLKQAHKRDIKVILDMVMNHTSKTHPWFLASERKDPKYKDWYIWSSKSMDQLNKEGWKKPWSSGNAWDVWHYSQKRKQHFYATWGGELNFKNRNVKKEVAKIAKFWLNKGVDGYRLDAIRYLIEEGPDPLQADTQSSLEYMKQYQATIKKANPQAMTVGEVWTQDHNVAKYYLEGKGFDQAFSFDFQGHVANALTKENGKGLYYYIKSFKKRKTGPNYFAPFLDNHDMKRIMGDFKHNFDKAKLGAAILLTFQGTPYVYFGSELGTLGRYNPMAWDSTKTGGFTTGRPWLPLSAHKDPRNVAAQIDDPLSLLNTYKDLIALRKKTPALTRGEIVAVRTKNKKILSYMRTGTNGTVLVILNLSGESQSAELDFSRTGMDVSNSYVLTPMKW